MTEEELQTAALSLHARKTRKPCQQAKPPVSIQPDSRPERFALDAFVEKYPRRLKATKNHPPG